MTDKRKVVVGHQAAHQVAFVGPYGVGKTTAVRSLSNLPFVGTEVASTVPLAPRHVAEGKLTTTVGIDYGEWRSPVGVVAIYGTPGQVRFRMNRTSALPRTMRMVLWCYGQNKYALEEAQEWLSYIGAAKLGGRLAVAVTRLDTAGGPPLKQYRPMLDAVHGDIALVAADPRSGEDVAAAVLACLGASQTGEALGT